MLTEREYTQAAERYLDMVYRIALNWFRHPADAEDVAQNVMLDVREREDKDAMWEAIRAAGDEPYVVGRIETGKKGVTLC